MVLLCQQTVDFSRLKTLIGIKHKYSTVQIITLFPINDFSFQNKLTFYTKKWRVQHNVIIFGRLESCFMDNGFCTFIALFRIRLKGQKKGVTKKGVVQSILEVPNQREEGGWLTTRGIGSNQWRIWNFPALVGRGWMVHQNPIWPIFPKTQCK